MASWHRECRRSDSREGIGTNKLQTNRAVPYPLSAGHSSRNPGVDKVANVCYDMSIHVIIRLYLAGWIVLRE